MPTIDPSANRVIIFDVDYTLLGLFFKLCNSDIAPHLKPVQPGIILPANCKALLPDNMVANEDGTYTPNFHMIYAAEMGAIFRALLQAKIQIAFITRSSYDSAAIKKLLEKEYGLEENCLSNTLYINSVNTPQLKNRQVPKARFIHKAVCANKFGPEPKVTLVDDDMQDVEQAKDTPYNLHTIIAQGQRDPRSSNNILQPSDPKYLLQIIQTFNLLAVMPKEDQNLFMDETLRARSRSSSLSSQSTAISSPGAVAVLFRGTAPVRIGSTIPEEDDYEPDGCWFCFKPKPSAR